MTDNNYTIGEISELSGVSLRRTRFYSDEGLLPPMSRTSKGYRVYSESDLAPLGLIRALRDRTDPMAARLATQHGDQTRG